MTMSKRLAQYLDAKHIPYQTIEHYHSNSSIGTAINAQVPPQQLAKAVMLKDHEDRKVMAILPAKNKISLSALNDELMGSYQLLKEQEVYKLFKDCEHGAIPPVAEAFNMSYVCDELLDGQERIYIEAGDHKTLLAIERAHFAEIMANGRHMRFSREVFH